VQSDPDPAAPRMSTAPDAPVIVVETSARPCWTPGARPPRRATWCSSRRAHGRPAPQGPRAAVGRRERGGGRGHPRRAGSRRWSAWTRSRSAPASRRVRARAGAAGAVAAFAAARPSAPARGGRARREHGEPRCATGEAGARRRAARAGRRLQLARAGPGRACRARPCAKPPPGPCGQAQGRRVSG
jgi:hypothetical protein